MGLRIRPETPGDIGAIRHVHDHAFGGPLEGRLVDRLRAAGDLVHSLVALDEAIIGHVAYSRLRISGGAPEHAVALAPVGVVPAHQSDGVGTALIQQGARELAAAGENLVFVLGDPAYYGRFGFSAEIAQAFDAPWPGEAFQALWLVEPVPQPGGMVHYPDAFSALEE